MSQFLFFMKYIKKIIFILYNILVDELKINKLLIYQ